MRPVLGHEHPEYNKGRWVGVVLDCGEVVWKTEAIPGEPDDREARLDWYDDQDELRERAKQWLDQNKPNWQDPLAYW